MRRLRDTTAVRRPVDETQKRIEAFLAERDTGGIARLRLRVPVNGPTKALGVLIDREVTVEATREAEQTFISWAPAGPLVFPSFQGRLGVRTAPDSNTCSIELEGSYTAPFGEAGQIFDETLGREIARATARELLETLGRAIEGEP